MTQPLVSLLVPIYNVERYLRECLDSARNQTLRDIEVICINDGSKDSSRDIIQEYLDSDERFRVIDKPNSGYGASMNMGLDAARGKYVGILESDDFFEPDALELLYNACERNNADAAKANFWFYWSAPEPRNEFFEIVTPEIANTVIDTQRVHDLFYKKNSIWSCLYRRDLLNDNGIRFLETPGASYQDAAFDFKVWACARRVACVGQAIIHYRQDNEASSVNSPSKVYCVCDEYEEMDRFLDSRPEKKASLKSVEEKMKYDSYMWNYDRLASELAGEFINRFAEEFRRDTDAGFVDLSLFEPWKQEDLACIMRSPQAYHAWRCGRPEDSAFKRLMLLVNAKGWGSAVSALRNRFSRR